MQNFNLIISGDFKEWDSGLCSFPIDRIFEYTDESIKSWLSPLSNPLNLRELESLPTIIANEEKISQSARVVHLSNLRIIGKDIQFRFEDRKDFSVIPNLYSETLRFALGIEHDFEKSRTHWAVKEGSIFNILTDFRIGKRETIAEGSSATSNRVFLVHGHDEAALEKVARFLERVGLLPIILKEQPDGGKTIIEKFEHHAEQASFAVVLLTPDDLGFAKDTADQQYRARQNVILELGYFVGALSRSRVCALKKGDIELPNDILGLLWKEFDSRGAWMLELAKELKHAGLPVDVTKII